MTKQVDATAAIALSCSLIAASRGAAPEAAADGGRGLPDGNVGGIANPTACKTKYAG